MGELLNEVTLMQDQALFKKNKQKGVDHTSLSRSRNYKGVKIQKKEWGFTLLILLLILVGFIVAKDIKLLLFLGNSNTIKNIFLYELKLSYHAENTIILYKNTNNAFIYSNISQSNYQKNLTALNKSLDELKSLGKFFYDLFENYSPLNVNYKTFLDRLYVDDICDILKKYKNNKNFEFRKNSKYKECSYNVSDLSQRKGIIFSFFLN